MFCKSGTFCFAAYTRLTKKIKTRIKKVLLFIIISVSLMDKNIFLSAKLETEMSFQPFCKAGLIPTY